MDVDEVAVPLAEVDVPEEAGEVLEGSIVVCKMVGTDTDAGEVPATVEVPAREEVERVRDGF